MKKVINFVLIGRSGCGKGTQAKLLMKRFKNLYYLATGDLFRELSKTDSAVAKKIKKILEKGGLPYDDLATTLWMHKLSFNLKDGQGIMADGFPRRLEEAKNLQRFLEFLGEWKNTVCLLVDISKKEAFSRLTKRRICKKCKKLIPWVGKFKDLRACDKCGGKLIVRVDDNKKAINNRLNYYEKQVVPVINYFKKQKKLIRVDGEQPIEDVFKDILRAIK